MKKIIIHTSEFPPGPGGIGNHAYNLAHSLTDRGKNVEVIVSTDGSNSKSEMEFDNKQTYKVHRHLKSNSKFVTYYRLINKMVSLIQRNPDVMVLTSGMVPLIVGGILKTYFLKRNKFVVVVHGLDIHPSNKYLKRLVNWSLKKYNQIIAVSSYTASKLPENLNNISTVINNGFDVTKFKNPENMTEINSPVKGNPSLVTVGTVWERKGQINVVNALPEIIRQHPDVHYHIIGLPKETNVLVERANKLGVESNITIHGMLTDSELLSILKNSTVFLMLSTHTASGDFEGFGIAILEANYVGVPAIGSKDCGIEDAIRNNKTGVLVNPKNSYEIAEALKNIIERRDEFSEASRNFALEHTWDKIIKQYLDVLEN